MEFGLRIRRSEKFTAYRQLDQMDCGPTCLRMISKYYGKHYSLQTLRDISYITRDGVSLNGISEAATKIGFRTYGARLTFDQLDEEATLPASPLEPESLCCIALPKL